MRLHVIVEGVPDRFGLVAVGQIDMCNLAFGVNTCIGATGDDTGDRLTLIEMGGGLLEHFLD